MSAPFVHLHLHSEYSLADSTIRIGELVSARRAVGQPAVAVTDLDNLFAAVKFYKAPRAPASSRSSAPTSAWPTATKPRAHDPAVPRSRVGYLTLSRLLSRAWMEGHRHRRRRHPSRTGCARTTPACSRWPAATAWPGGWPPATATNWPKRAGRWRGTFGDACTWN
jgi:DNA polymerase III alpha subunit